LHIYPESPAIFVPSQRSAKRRHTFATGNVNHERRASAWGNGAIMKRAVGTIAESRKAKAYRTLCGLVLISISMPAASQALRGNCGNPDPDISIAACTKKITLDTAELKSGSDIIPQAAVAHLATDYDSRGVAYASKGLYDQAIADFNQAISLSPRTFPVAYLNRGSAYDHQGLDEKAIVDYTTAISLEPKGADPDFNLADAYDYRGNVYERNGLFDKALADFTMAISLNPSLENAYANRGNDYARKALYDLAIADFSKVISLDSRDVGSRYNRALAYEHQGLYDDAISDLSKEISLAPNFADAYDRRGLAYAHMGQYDQAIADYTQEIALNAKNIQLHPGFSFQYANAYSHRGGAYEHKGGIDAAIADYRAALKLYPDMQSAKDALTRLGAVP
jgi:tetratricopeptide (TPR) repeat protein